MTIDAEGVIFLRIIVYRQGGENLYRKWYTVGRPVEARRIGTISSGDDLHETFETKVIR